MGFLEPTAQYAFGGVMVAALVVFLLFQPTSLVRWLQKKNYQYEVTFSLYMLTPTEKFIFNSVLFLTFSTLTVACILYLPDHVSTIGRRAYYYFAGDNAATSEISHSLAETGSSAIRGAATASDAMKEAATDFAHTAYAAAASTAVAAQEVVKEAAGLA